MAAPRKEERHAPLCPWDHYLGTGKNGVGTGAKGRPHKASGDGPGCAYLDPIEPWRFAEFDVCIETPKDSGEFRRYVGPLR